MKPNVLLFVSNVSGFVMAELAALKKVANVRVWERPCNMTEEAKRMHPDIPWYSYYEQDTAEKMLTAMGEFTPEVFLCVSWVMKPAMELARMLKRRGCVNVLLVDTPWRGDCRQIGHALFSRFTLVRLFDYAWGAGAPQAKHMRILGFPPNRVKEGFLCADTQKFAELVHFGKGRWPHVFLYVGRYITVKNMRRMERAFLRAVDKNPSSDWVLRCVGGGDADYEDLWSERTIHPRIEHLGYKSPTEIQVYVKDGGCFVLPSIRDNWGVVVHEFAIAGLPLLCSKQVQATTQFLSNGVNGYLFDAYDEDDICDKMCKVMQMADEELEEMGRRSHAIGMSYTTQDWANRVLSFLGDR